MTQTKHGRRKIARTERRVAVELGGRKTFASGSGDEKGDGRVPQQFTKTAGGIVPLRKYPLRIENKTTANHSYTLHADTWFTLKRAAVRAGEFPLMHLTLCDTGIRLQLAVLARDLAEELRLINPYLGTRLWRRFLAAKSYTISSTTWMASPSQPISVELRPPPGEKVQTDEYLLVVSYPELKNALEKYGP